MKSRKRKPKKIENRKEKQSKIEEKCNEEKTIMNIDDLPDELLIYIFRFLSQFTIQTALTLVSKKWYDVVRNDSKLSGELFPELTNTHSIQNINQVLKKWPKLQVLKIPISFKVKRKPLKKLDTNPCPNLKKIEIFYKDTGMIEKWAVFKKFKGTVFVDIFKKFGISKHAKSKIQISSFCATPNFWQSFDYEEITEIQCSVMIGGHFRIENLENEFSALIEKFPNLRKIIVDNGIFGDQFQHHQFLRNLEDPNYWNGMVTDFLTFLQSDVVEDTRKKCELGIRLQGISILVKIRIGKPNVCQSPEIELLHLQYTVDNKKTHPPCFSTFRFSRISPEPFELQKICLHLFAHFSKELSIGTRVFQIW